METTDTRKASDSAPNGEASKGTQGEGTPGTRRKLSDQQEQEVTRLYSETETPVSEISKRFGIGESSVYRVAQRHGAALRGRTSTAASTATATPEAAAPVAATPVTATRRRGAGRPPGSGRGRRAAAAVAPTTATPTAAAVAPAPAAATGRGISSTGNGRRTRGPGRATGTRARRAATTIAAAPAAAPTPRVARGPRAAAVVVATSRSFRVSFIAVREFAAANMADAIRQAEAAGATDITGIQRND